MRAFFVSAPTRSLKPQLRFVEQNPHQLWNRHRRMCIVELDRDFLGKRAPIGVIATKASHDISKRAGDKKILLNEPQALPQARGVVRIKHSGQRLGGKLLCQRAHEITVAEFLKVEVVRRGGGPQSK